MISVKMNVATGMGVNGLVVAMIQAKRAERHVLVVTSVDEVISEWKELLPNVTRTSLRRFEYEGWNVSAETLIIALEQTLEPHDLYKLSTMNNEVWLVNSRTLGSKEVGLW